MKTIFGIKGWNLSEYAISANAILGIRDSGKTYTATEAAEELFDAGVPFIALDPIGVWHSLRIPGKGKGYPVVVAGGKRGDLPLTIKNAGSIVRAAMEAGVSLVIDLFSVELSKADWRRIVRETVEILLHENSDFGLRHVFIEEAAEFVPQRVQDGQVFAAVEKLVRMGGNSKLGCTLVNQRSADLNKSVLELCANVFVHRQTGKNTLLDLKKWLEVMALDKAEQARIADSLPDLKSGECWAFINDLKKPVRLRIPAKNSQHPDRRASVAPGAMQRAPVPATDFVEQMRSKLAEKDKPKPMPVITSKPVEKVNPVDLKAQERVISAARQEGYAAGYLDGDRDGFARGAAVALDQGFGAVRDALKAFAGVKFVPPKRVPSAPRISLTTATSTPAGPPPALARPGPARPPASAVSRHEGFSAPQGLIMDAMIFWDSVGKDMPTRDQVAGISGYHPRTGNFRAAIGQLIAMGQIQNAGPGALELTGASNSAPISHEVARDRLLERLSGPSRTILDAVLKYKGPVSREQIASDTGYHPRTGNFRAAIGKLITLTVLDKCGVGAVAVSEWAREVLG